MKYQPPSTHPNAGYRNVTDLYLLIVLMYGCGIIKRSKGKAYYHTMYSVPSGLVTLQIKCCIQDRELLFQITIVIGLFILQNKSTNSDLVISLQHIYTGNHLLFLVL